MSAVGSAAPDVAAPAPASASGLGWRVLKNSVAQGGGRIVIAAARLVTIGLIVRAEGKTFFGEYSLVIGLLTLAEWVADFGTTEVFVRELCREPGRRLPLLRTLAAAKFVQVPVAFAALALVLVAMRYPARVVEAGLVAGIGLVFFGGVLVYRAIFRVDLTMEREVIADLFAVVGMLPPVWLAVRAHAGLAVLAACYAASRGLFLAGCVVLGRSSFRLSVAGATRAGVREALRGSAAIGASGLLVVLYDTLDVLLLARFGSLTDVGLYAAAQKLVWPVLAALTAIGTTLYPVMASYWPHSRKPFEEACQRGFETVVLVALVAVTAVLAAPRLFLRLLGPDLVEAAPALVILALLIVVKSVSQTVGPVLYLVYRQTQLLRLVAAAVVLKGLLVAAVSPRFGFRGVALSALALELLFALRTLALVRRYTGFTPRLGNVVKGAAAAALAVAAARLALGGLPLAAAVAAPLLYVPLVFFTGAVRIADLRALLSRNSSTAPEPALEA